MKIKYLGTAAAEGVPAIFCRCEVCRKSKAAGGRNIRTRSQSIIDDRLLLDFCPAPALHTRHIAPIAAKIPSLAPTAPTRFWRS